MANYVTGTNGYHVFDTCWEEEGQIALFVLARQPNAGIFKKDLDTAILASEAF